MADVSSNIPRPSPWASGLSGALKVGAYALTLVLVLALVVFTLKIVRPFGSQTADLPPESVAQSWNDSISRLGITPVFPPEEDFNVGDVWAIIDNVAPQTPAVPAGDGSPAPIKDDVSLLGKAVRIAHIDLRQDLLRDRSHIPVFADTVKPKTSDDPSSQDRFETVAPGTEDKIGLSITAFPGITIAHNKRASSAFGWGLGAFGVKRDDVDIDEIKIPVAETYGISAAVAIGRLDEWCHKPESAIYCQEAFIRRVLAYAVSQAVLDQQDGKYVFHVQLQLVNRVFVARSIEQRRAVDTTSGGALRVAPKGAAAPAPDAGGSSAAPSATPAVEALGRDVTARAANAASAADGSYVNGDGSELVLRQTFQRPVAFGYRSVSFILQP